MLPHWSSEAVQYRNQPLWVILVFRSVVGIFAKLFYSVVEGLMLLGIGTHRSWRLDCRFDIRKENVIFYGVMVGKKLTAVGVSKTRSYQTLITAALDLTGGQDWATRGHDALHRAMTRFQDSIADRRWKRILTRGIG